MKSLPQKLLTFILAALILTSVFSACNKSDEEETSTETETDPVIELPEDFDYASADISSLITLDRSEFESMTVTLSTAYVYTEEMLEQQLKDELFDNKTKTDGDTKVTDQPIKLGDSAFIYYTGYLDGVAFDGGSNAASATPHELSIGSGTFIPGFEEGLIGVIPENTSKDSPYDLHVTFPEEYSNSPDLAGKAVVFKVWVEYVIQYTIPEFNDEFVKETYKYDGSAEEYKAEIGKALKEELEEQARGKALTAAINMLIEAADIHEYPEVSVNYWYDMLIDQYEYYMALYGMYGYSFKSLDEFVPLYLGLSEDEDWKEVTRTYAKDTIANLLVHYAIADALGISVTDEEYAEGLRELAESYSSDSSTVTPEEIEEQYGKQAILQGLLIDKVEEYLSGVITIEYKD